MTQENESYRSSSVLIEVLNERRRQDDKWGGPKHDDHHVDKDWLGFISKRSVDKGARNPKDRRQNLLEIAALAVAAIESMDRKAGS